MLPLKYQETAILKAQEAQKKIENAEHENFSGVIVVRDDINQMNFLTIRTDWGQVERVAKLIAAGLNSELEPEEQMGNYLTDKGFTVTHYILDSVPISEKLLNEWMDQYIDWSNENIDSDKTIKFEPTNELIEKTRNLLRSREL